MQLIVAEKPSVARDLARVLGVRPSGRGAFEGRERVISWCIGHLVELDEPAAYDPRWKAWRLDTLPMLPERFKLRPVASSRDQLQSLQALLRDRRFQEVVNACDAGREGELIFRYVYDLAGCRLPVRRLWISSLTDEAVRRGFENLRPGAEYDALADAARSRSEADWLVGLNATRAVTVRNRRGPDSPLYSIGRVQTPTLALLVQREKTIQSFTPRDYWEVRGTFVTAGAERFEGLFTYQRHSRLAIEEEATALLQRLGQQRRPLGPPRTGGRAGPAEEDPGTAAPAVRPHLVAADREPTVRVLGQPHAGDRPGSVRDAQGPDLPPHGFALPHPGLARHDAATVEDPGGRARICRLRAAAAGGGRGAAREQPADLRRQQGRGPPCDHSDRQAGRSQLARPRPAPPLRSGGAEVPGRVLSRRGICVGGGDRASRSRGRPGGAREDIRAAA